MGKCMPNHVIDSQEYPALHNQVMSIYGKSPGGEVGSPVLNGLMPKLRKHAELLNGVFSLDCINQQLVETRVSNITIMSLPPRALCVLLYVPGFLNALNDGLIEWGDVPRISNYLSKLLYCFPNLANKSYTKEEWKTIVEASEGAPALLGEMPLSLTVGKNWHQVVGSSSKHVEELNRGAGNEGIRNIVESCSQKEKLLFLNKHQVEIISKAQMHKNPELKNRVGRAFFWMDLINSSTDARYIMLNSAKELQKRFDLFVRMNDLFNTWSLALRETTWHCRITKVTEIIE